MFLLSSLRPLTGPALALLLAWSLAGCGADHHEETAKPRPAEAVTGAFPNSFNPGKLERTGPASCVECHAGIVADWERSHHAKANRPVDPLLDRPAFEPARSIAESGVNYELVESGDDFVLRVVQADGSTEDHTLAGVIGYTPLRQYLAEFPGGRLQTISPSYDIFNDDWFDVFAGEDRLPGEWGHWTGQGMNWNANCAYCHTTEYEKGYDFETDRYRSRWVQQGIACAECHGGLETHIHAARIGDKKTTTLPLDRRQVMDNCASCHSRRDQLTADAFALGDAYHDHFSLSAPDQPGLYYADGQILDEVFVHASFRMSRMAHAGVSCMDCHNPHTLETILPVADNQLCLRCHEGGTMNAPVIKPLEHSFHPAGSTGNRCVECHMPKTKYMQIDPRADHGFHMPDPLLTRELDIPNACSKCHDDKPLDWSIEWSEKWYGEKLAAHPQRARARAIAAAYRLDPQAAKQLLELAAKEDIPFWRATYTGLLGNFVGEPGVRDHLEAALQDEDPMVRERAILALPSLPDTGAKVIERLGDASRSVRLAAARALSTGGAAVPDPKAAAEWRAYLEFNTDRPQTLMLLANEALTAGDAAKVRKYLKRAVALDRLNPGIYHQSAILLSTAGDNETAEAYLYTGWEIAPRDALFPYSLGLLRAEQDRLDECIAFLKEAVALEPGFQRAWYNLSLAYMKAGRQAEAAAAMQRAQGR